MTLRDLERALKFNGEAKNKVDFYDNCGCRLAYSTTLKHVFQLKTFRMDIDTGLQYLCHNLQGFGEHVTQLSTQ